MEESGARELQNIHDYVQERGGSLVFIAGPLYTPLAYKNSPISKLFPIEFSRLDQLKPNDSTGFDVEYRLNRTHLGNRRLR